MDATPRRNNPKLKKLVNTVDAVMETLTPEQQAAIGSDDDAGRLQGGQSAASQPAASPDAAPQSSPAVADAQPPPPAPVADAQPTAPAVAPQSQPAQVAAPADPWAEYEEVTHPDADVGESYTVRALKKDAEKVKNGYARRSIMDRHSTFLGQHRSWLEPLATNGQLDAVAPIIQLALQDREYAEAMVQAANRRRLNLPMWEQQQNGHATPAPQVAPAAAPQQQQAADMLAHIDADPELDEWTKARFKASLAPLAAALQQANERYSNFSTREQQWEQQQQQQREQAQQQEQARRAGDAAAQAMMQQFPGRTQDEYQRAWTYGQQSGIFQRYGVNGAAAILAYQGYTNPMGLQGLGRDPVPSTLAQAAVQGQRLAAAAAATVAPATTPTGAGAPQEDPNVAKQRLTRFRTGPDGKKRPVSATNLANQMIAKGMV